MTNREKLSVDPSKRKLYSKAPAFIGRNIWVEDKVTILPNVIIGKGAVVAAGAVVTKDIPPFTIWAGVPAKQIGERTRCLNYKITLPTILY